MTSAFDRDLALAAGESPGQFLGEFHDRWYIDRAMHGGHVIAAMVRGLEAGVNDPARSLRSVTVHFVAPAQSGPFELNAVIDRSGRSLSSVRGQILQNGAVIASSLAAFGADWESIEWDRTSMPKVPPMAECPDLWEGGGGTTNLHKNLMYGRAIGGRFFSGEMHPESGGWLRLVEPRPLDAALVAAMTDTWPPTPLMMVDRPVLFPTIDLTVHIVRPLPLTGPAADAECFVWHRIDQSRAGYLVQDTEVWSSEGELLAVARQNALLIPR